MAHLRFLIFAKAASSSQTENEEDAQEEDVLYFDP